LKKNDLKSTETIISKMTNKVSTYEPPLFERKDVPLWKDYFDEHGYVMIKKVLSEQDKLHAFGLFAEDWRTVSPRFNFHNKETWSPANSPMMWNKGMIYWNGLGQSNFMWYLRTHPNILNIFKDYYETDDLVTSFDGFSLFLNNNQKPGTWLHTDKNPKWDMESIQGAYNFLPVGEDDAGFMVVPGSHKSYKPDIPEWQQFIPIDEDDEHNEKAVKLLIPDNCFLLWNSLTIHSNVGMVKKGVVELNRLTAYITYFPKELRSEEVYGRRVNGYRLAHNCSHYGIYHDPKRHPARSGSRYEARGFKWIEPKLDEDGEIPADRLELI
jgi:hypothetical protein